MSGLGRMIALFLCSPAPFGTRRRTRRDGVGICSPGIERWLACSNAVRELISCNDRMGIYLWQPLDHPGRGSMWALAEDAAVRVTLAAGQVGIL